MSDATARYVVTADDRSKAALNSIQSGFRSMDRGVKSTLRSMNLALGIFAGVQLKQAFRRILDATAQSTAGQRGFAQALKEVRAAAGNLLAAKSGLPEATRKMQELRDVLKDPSVVAAADALTSSLISGFTGATKAIAGTIAGIRELAKDKTVGGARSSQDVVDAIDAQIARKEAQIAALRGGGGFIKGERGLDSAHSTQLASLQREIDELRADQERAFSRDPTQRGPLGRRGTSAAGQARAHTRQIAQDQADRLAALERDTAIGGSRFARRRFGIDQNLDEANQILDDLVDAEKESQKLMDSLEEIDTIAIRQKKIFQEFRSETAETIAVFTDGFKNAFADMIQTGKFSMREFSQFLLAELTKKQIFKAIDDIGASLNRAFSQRSSGGSSRSGFSYVANILPGLFGLAEGGPASAGRPYIVGERGPELFVPRDSGTVVPNHRMGGNVTFAPTYYVDAKGADAERVLQVVPIAMEQTHERAVGTFLRIMRKNGFRLT